MLKQFLALALLVGLGTPSLTWAQGRDGATGRPDSPPGQAARDLRPGQGPKANGPQDEPSGLAEGAGDRDAPICPSGVIPHPAECQCPGAQRPEPLMRSLGDVDYRCPDS